MSGVRHLAGEKGTRRLWAEQVLCCCPWSGDASRSAFTEVGSLTGTLPRTFALKCALSRAPYQVRPLKCALCDRAVVRAHSGQQQNAMAWFKKEIEKEKRASSALEGSKPGKAGLGEVEVAYRQEGLDL